MTSQRPTRSQATRRGTLDPLARRAPAIALASLATCGFVDPSEDTNLVIAGGVPMNEYCEPVADWPPESTRLEVDVLALVNELRRRGAECGSAGAFAPAPPLRESAALRCAARVHARDMAETGLFSHEDSEGQGPKHRVERAGYIWTRLGENIAAGADTADAVVRDLWMKSDPHCANIMDATFTEVGLAFTKAKGQPYDTYWAQDFGRPR